MAPKVPEGVSARVLVPLMAFFMTIITLIRLVMFHVTKKLPSTPKHGENISEPNPGAQKEEFRPPSPSSSLSQVDLLSSVLKRLGDLEEKVDMLQAKPSEMPYEKEELLNAAVCRVDALEAELIATKKVQLWVLIMFCMISAQVITFIIICFHLKTDGCGLLNLLINYMCLCLSRLFTKL